MRGFVVRLSTYSTKNSLGYYLPKRKPLSAYISDVCAYTSDLANGPENQCLHDKIGETLGQGIGMLLA